LIELAKNKIPLSTFLFETNEVSDDVCPLILTLLENHTSLTTMSLKNNLVPNFFFSF